MANPNIVAVSTITGKTSVLVLTGTAANIVSNSTGSNRILKVDSLYIANTTTSAATVTVDVTRSSTAYRIASTITVPANATLVVIDKTTNLFLEEGDGLRGLTGTANALHAVASYEEIS
jgi:hypothetical protein